MPVASNQCDEFHSALLEKNLLSFVTTKVENIIAYCTYEFYEYNFRLS